MITDINRELFIETQMPEPGSRVAVGMSGGVDSTLTALLLKERGCTVIGITMSMWNNDLPIPNAPDGIKQSCYSPDEQTDIRACRVFCEEHGIEYHVIEVKDAYRKHVLEYFRSEYRNGRTPNPCIECNKFVKFGAFLENAVSSGVEFDYFCTGHYARIVRSAVPVYELYGITDEEYAERSKNDDNINLHPLLIKNADDATKDQGYFLYRVPSGILEKVRFPLSSFTKKEVFKMASERRLAAAERRESQDYASAEITSILLSDKAPQKGFFIDTSGKKLGHHKGIEFYTIGQRRGLGVSAPEALYVKEIDCTTANITLSSDEDLKAAGLTASDWVWAGNYVPSKPFKADVKIRLAAKAVPAEISVSGDCVTVLFEKPQRAVAPGQSAVVYLNGAIMGGGIITRTILYE